MAYSKSYIVAYDLQGGASYCILPINAKKVGTNRVCAIYQIILVLGWKTYKYYYETDELPNPRPTQPKKKLV